MSSPTFERLYREISETQQRRNKLDVLKITFVSALLGFGAVKVKDITAFYQALYVAPLVAVFMDLLVMGEHFSIRRIGAFLRLYSASSPEEHAYEAFVGRHRDVFFLIGSRGFSVLSFVAAVGLLRSAKGVNLTWVEWSWFGTMFLFFIGMLFWGRRPLKALDDLKELETDSGQQSPGGDSEHSVEDGTVPGAPQG